MRPLADLVRLAGKNGGMIPSTIPVHYVEWALSFHRHRRKKASLNFILKKPSRKYAAPRMFGQP